MLRQLLALLALIAGLTSLPASAETRLTAHSGRQVELAVSTVATVRTGIPAAAIPSGPAEHTQGNRDAIATPDLVAVAPLAVRIGVDRAHE